MFIKYLIFFTVFYSNNIAKILIYADSITYDESENIITEVMQILHKNNLIISDLIIYNQLEEKYFYRRFTIKMKTIILLKVKMVIF